MKRIKKSYVSVLLLGIALIVIGGLVWKASSNKIPDGYVLVESYVDYDSMEGDFVQCAANAPGCGVCGADDEGKVINGKCYVPKGSAHDGL